MQSNNRKYLLIGRHVFFVGTLLILVWFLLNNLSFFWDFIQKIYVILTPFVYGFVFAYLLKSVVNWLERRVFVFVWKEPEIKENTIQNYWKVLLNKERRKQAINKVMNSTAGNKKLCSSIEEVEKLPTNKKKLNTLLNMYLDECDEKRINGKETAHQKSIKNHAFEILRKKIINQRIAKRKKMGRSLSIITTYVCILVLIGSFIYILVPNLIDSINGLINQVPIFIDAFEEWASWMQTQDMSSYVDIPTGEEMVAWLKGYSTELERITTNTIPWAMDMIKAITNGIIDAIIGLVVSIYMLANKETFAQQAKRVACAILPKKRAKKTIEISRMIDETFGGYISSRIITSIFIGILCYIGMKLLDIPYAILVSVIVGITNMLPYIGPFIGGIPSALMILVVDPVKAVIFVVFITVLQQLEGNVISVLITGKKTGMSAFWVMFSVMLGGGLFGVWGMFIGVPFFAVFYALSGENLREKLSRKGCTEDIDKYLNEE